MNKVLHQAGIALEGLYLRYGVDPTNDRIFVIFETSGDETYVLWLTANNDARDISIACSLTPVSPRQKSKVALFLAEQLNARFKYVTFSIFENHVVADVSVDLEVASDPSAAIAKAIKVFLAVLQESRQPLLRVARSRNGSGSNKTVRDAEQILDDLDFN